MTAPALSSSAESAARPSISIETRSVAETRALGSALAEAAEPGDVIWLIGPLGAGKTQLAKGFALGLGVAEVVNSPSFTLMAEYHGRLPLFHQDLYRLAGSAEAMEGGLLDERRQEGVTLTEWAERLDLPAAPPALEVRFELGSEDDRRITLVVADEERGGRYLAAAAAWEARGRTNP